MVKIKIELPGGIDILNDLSKQYVNMIYFIFKK